ncbi:diacylglycerol kinase [Opitutus sp. GAS368]|nr:diacylglycerol kinase [Opitutus sp. GAS368]
MEGPRPALQKRFVRGAGVGETAGVSEPIPQPENKRRDFRNFLSSIKYAVEGFWAAVRHEPSFREDLLFVAILTPFAIILPVKAVSTAVMLSSLSIIIIAELLNSAVEWTIDDISLEKRPFAKRAKDMGSAAVFLAYINCAVVWGVIFYSNWHRIATLEFLRWPPEFLQ